MDKENNHLNKDDEDWLAVLGGQYSKDVKAEVLQNARFWRAALLAQEEIPDSKPQNLQKILDEIETTQTKPAVKKTVPWFKQIWFLPVVSMAFSVFLIVGIILHDVPLKPATDSQAKSSYTITFLDQQLNMNTLMNQLSSFENIQQDTQKNALNINFAALPQSQQQQLKNVLSQYHTQWPETQPAHLVIQFVTLPLYTEVDPNPQQRAQAIQQNFEQAGATTQLTQVNAQQWQLDIQLPAQLNDDLLELFSEYPTEPILNDYRQATIRLEINQD